MKTLYLIRHAKAGWDKPELTDFDRPLTELGQQHAHNIGQELKPLIKPDLIISSLNNGQYYCRRIKLSAG